jgi:N6-adenosine-specific RNA methylase IME4
LSEVLKYDEACRMLAEAAAVDEVLDMRSKADALRIYARQAKNRDMEINAAQIRVRAERRLGEMLIQQRESVGLATGAAGIGKAASAVPEEYSTQPMTLAEVGIDRKLSSRAQRIAEIGPVRFEALMAMMREQAGEGRVIVDVLKIDAENEQRQKRRDLAAAMSHATALSPTGQKVPCIYADPPWHRNQGVTNRSYENHYPTMSWDEICAMPVAERLLPDAWLFLWIPRAHMFALHVIEIEVTDVRTGEIIMAAVDMPLAWAVAKSWGFDAYSTAFIWTKTDEEHPLDQGGGVLVYDQDEVLLMFKRGRGLPKPATNEKFKSNHRERKREHSRKPDHYREVIQRMTGGVPVLELFARVDAEHPLPGDWIAWGNQAQASNAADITDAVPPETDTSAGGDAIRDGIVSQPLQSIVIPYESESVVEQLLSLDLSEQIAPDSIAPTADFAAAFERELSDDEFVEWHALHSIAAGDVIPPDVARGVIGDGQAAILNEDKLALTADGFTRLRALQVYVERCERRHGRTLGYNLDLNPPRQIDFEEVLQGAA